MFISESLNRLPKFTNPNGEILQEILGNQVSGIQSHSLAEVVIPPGMSSDAHYHKIAEESYLIHSEEAEMVVNQVRIIRKPDDALLIQPEETHQIYNHGQSDLVFIATCVPAWQPDDNYPINATESL
jgi:mannose-6-phosphate isomerase-like protein (cupin superfamily)